MTELETPLIEAPEKTAPTQYNTVAKSWNFSVDNIRGSTPHFHPDDQADLIALFKWCTDERHPLLKSEAAARLGCSEDLIYQLLTGRYRNVDKSPKGPSDEFMERLRNFLKVERDRYEAISSDFIVTPTAKKVFTACDLARESKTPVILYGPSHVGKTLALQHYAHHHNHGRTFMAEMDADCGKLGAFRILATACGVALGNNHKDELVARIKKALCAPDTILIIDEMHLTRRTYSKENFKKIVETIRRIHDFTKCGMVLTWTNLDDLREFSQDELIQVWRRGIHKVALPMMPTKADLTAILKHNGLDFPDRSLSIRVGNAEDNPYEILRQQAKNNGLKAITERIRYAHKLATKKDGQMSWTHFVDAHLRIEKQSQAEPEWN